MNANDSIQTGGAVIRVPFWVVALASGSLLAIGYAIYWLATNDVLH